MAQTYRVGLVGCGRMGTTIDDEVRDRPNARLFLPYSHAAAVVACERTELVAVCDPVADKAETARQRYGAHSAYEDPEEMIRKEGLDVVCIATRPSPHAPVTLLAAENGVRAIYCEKPLCNSMAEADAMAAAVVAHGVKFNYGTQRRYVRMYRNLREMIDAGHIGQRARDQQLAVHRAFERQRIHKVGKRTGDIVAGARIKPFDALIDRRLNPDTVPFPFAGEVSRIELGEIGILDRV